MPGVLRKDSLQANLTAVNPTGIYSSISYLSAVERTLCADSSACSHTHQALRGKETYGVFCIRFGFKIASLLLSFPSMASWKDSNELETPCLLWHGTHAHQHTLAGWTFLCEFDKHICSALLISRLLSPPEPLHLYFSPVLIPSE